MGPFAWLALAGVLLVFMALYLLRRTRRPVTNPERSVDFEAAEELGVELEPPTFPEDTESWLPRAYGEHYIRLLVRDARCLYAYWELGEDTGPPGGLCLRLWQGDDQPGQEHLLSQRVGSWYFHGVHPSSRYIVSVGHTSGPGDFREVLRSPAVFTPPDRPSSLIDGDYIPGLWDAAHPVPSSPLRWRGRGGRP